MRAMYMLSAKVYNKEEFWFVDFLDSKRQDISAVGIFKQKEDAEQAAITWEKEQDTKLDYESI